MTKAGFHQVAAALTRAGVPFIVVGGIAVNEHGYGRNTFDVDVVIRLDPDSIIRAFAALAELGYRPRVPVDAQQFADPEQRRRLLERPEVIRAIGEDTAAMARERVQGS